MEAFCSLYNCYILAISMTSITQDDDDFSEDKWEVQEWSAAVITER